jgi:pilus assembly protein CpaB
MRRPVIYMMLAGLAAVLAATVVFSALRRREAEVQRAMAQSVEIVAAARDLTVGAKIDPEAVRLLRWPRDSVPPGAFTDPQAVVGAFTRGEFFANEPIVAGKLYIGERVGGVMPLLIPAGMRAMSVPVDEVADIAGFVQPHTRVDVLVAVSGGANDAPPFSRIVVQNVEVLAVAQEIEQTKDEPTVVKVVTLLVTPEEAEKLALASREGTLRLAMRNYTDTKIVATSGFDVLDLMHLGKGGGAPMPVLHGQPLAAHRAAPPAGPAPVTVEVLRDGNATESISFVNSAMVERTSLSGKPIAPRRALPAPPARPPAASSMAPAVASDAAKGFGTSIPAAAADDQSANGPAPADLRLAPAPKTIAIP